MRSILAVMLVAAHAGCGAETATTAAAGAAAKKREVEAGKQTLERAQGEIGHAMEQARERADADAGK